MALGEAQATPRVLAVVLVLVWVRELLSKGTETVETLQSRGELAFAGRQASLLIRKRIANLGLAGLYQARAMDLARQWRRARFGASLRGATRAAGSTRPANVCGAGGRTRAGRSAPRTSASEASRCA